MRGPTGVRSAAHPDDGAHLRRALASLEDALDHLDRYALATDEPAEGVVEVADALDDVRDRLCEVVGDTSPLNCEERRAIAFAKADGWR